MKAYKGSRGVGPHILNLGYSWSWVVSARTGPKGTVHWVKSGGKMCQKYLGTFGFTTTSAKKSFWPSRIVRCEILRNDFARDHFEVLFSQNVIFCLYIQCSR